jgi:hypothetical protein
MKDCARRSNTGQLQSHRPIEGARGRRTRRPRLRCGNLRGLADHEYMVPATPGTHDFAVLLRSNTNCLRCVIVGFINEAWVVVLFVGR